jgi:uncharacterized ferritin-like protein (DUF455 family)
MAYNVNFYQLAEDCLFSASVEEKLAAADRAAALRSSGSLLFEPASPPRAAAEVSFPERPLQVEPRELPRRSLGSEAGLAAFLHAVAHIEFTAIHLAFDIAYRFRDMPDSFRLDWLGVAIEEAAHFRLLAVRLRDLGAAYGDLPVHRGLWELAEETAHDVLHRLALVPRFMEARGLDVTPGMIAKLASHGDAASVAVLDVILREEVGHVALGSRWFGEVCRERGLDPGEEYFSLVRRYIRGAVRGPFNRAARLAAGFSPDELARLEGLDRAGANDAAG